MCFLLVGYPKIAFKCYASPSSAVLKIKGVRNEMFSLTEKYYNAKNTL